MNYDIKERAAENRLRDIRAKHPGLSDKIKEYISIKQDGRNLSAQEILFLIKCELASNSQNCFIVINVNDERYAGDKIEKIFLDAVHISHNGKLEIFHRSCVKDIIVSP